MIFEMVFCSEKSNPTAKFKSNGHSTDDKLDTSILLTCKQVREEAGNVLRRVRIARLFVFSPSEDKSAKIRPSTDHGLTYRLNLQDMDTFLQFRKLEITITQLWNNFALNYGQLPKGTVGSMLSSWVQLLKQQLADLNLTVAREISLSFRTNQLRAPLDPKYLASCVYGITSSHLITSFYGIF